MCDLAEYYHIIDYKSLPAKQVAILLCGLRDDSRVKMKIMGKNYTYERLMQALIFDKLNWLCWSQSSDSRKNVNKPLSIAGILMNTEEENDIKSFSSISDFEKACRNITGKEGKKNV